MTTFLFNKMSLWNLVKTKKLQLFLSSPGRDWPSDSLKSSRGCCRAAIRFTLTNLLKFLYQVQLIFYSYLIKQILLIFFSRLFSQFWDRTVVEFFSLGYRFLTYVFPTMKNLILNTSRILNLTHMWIIFPFAYWAYFSFFMTSLIKDLNTVWQGFSLFIRFFYSDSRHSSD